MNQSEVCDDIDNNCDWNGNFTDQSLILTSYEKLLILWSSLISVDRLDLQVIVYVGVYHSKTTCICTRARKVHGVWEWLNCMHVDTSEGGVVMSRCGFRSVRYLEVKIRCKSALGPTIVSAVRSLEVVASRRLPMYYKYGIFNP